MSRHCAMTIGNFDGVHLGHARLIETARNRVGPKGHVVSLTFDPHPISALHPGSEPLRLTTLEQRREHLTALGADEVVRLEPTKAVLDQTPEQFVAWLVNRYSPKFFVEGYDFRFGRARSGDVKDLERLGSQHGIETIIVDPVEAVLTDHHVVPVSSSLIRWLVARGRVADARCLLGRDYELSATIVEGEKRGREMGFPTVNLDTTGLAVPGDGVYAGEATIVSRGRIDDATSAARESPQDMTYPAAISVGTKPTFGAHPCTCEAHLIGYDGPLDDYGWEIRLRFRRWLRDQLFYGSIEDLIAQLNRDVENTVSLSRSGGPASLMNAERHCRHGW